MDTILSSFVLPVNTGFFLARTLQTAIPDKPRSHTTDRVSTGFPVFSNPAIVFASPSD